MTDREMAQILALLSTLDGRRITDISIEGWRSVVGHVPYDFAEQAVRQHYATSRTWLMPADIAVPWTEHLNHEAERERSRELLGPPPEPKPPGRLRELVAECERQLLAAKQRHDQAKPEPAE